MCEKYRRAAHMDSALEQILTCPVCLERFTPASGPRCPKLLPMCGHCFCLRCLNRLSVRALGEAVVDILLLPPHMSMTWSCPECRQEIQFGHEHTYSNPAALPNSLQTLRLLDAMQTFENGATPREILKRCARTHASARKTAEAEDGTTLHIV